MKNKRYVIVILLLCDYAMAFGAVLAAKFIQRILPQLSLPDELLYLKAAVFTTVVILCFYFQDLYDWKYWRRLSELVSSVLLGGGTTLIALALVYYILPMVALERDILLMALCISLGLSLGLRAMYLTLRKAEFAGTRVVILGDGKNAQVLLSELNTSTYPVIFEGYVGKCNPEIDCPHIGDVEALTDIVSRLEPDKLVIALDDRRGSLPLDDLLRIKLSSSEVVDAAGFYEDYMGKILIEEIRPSALIFSHGFLSTKYGDSLKRVFDVCAALLGIILTAPIMLLTALAIKLDSPGPVFYLQSRVGQHGREFKLIKFRSMRQDAEVAGPQWASQNDPRITRVGRIIRKLRIDELPQFFNMLKNDMSFVGPRPERRYFIEQLQEIIPFYAMRLYVKPGVTGWAQINYPYGDSIEDAKEKLKYELYYMKHRSLWLDISIILQTVKVALKARGAQ
ncbi:MAG: TIGR03013 family XrtA/PEP-CTERM system glycosyltransferase [Syntrophaceae bacterium]